MDFFSTTLNKEMDLFTENTQLSSTSLRNWKRLVSPRKSYRRKGTLPLSCLNTLKPF